MYPQKRPVMIRRRGMAGLGFDPTSLITAAAGMLPGLMGDEGGDGGLVPGTAGGGAAGPSVGVTTGVTVSPAIQTSISPQISPVFQQAFQPSNSGMTAGTAQTAPAPQTARTSSGPVSGPTMPGASPFPGTVGAPPMTIDDPLIDSGFIDPTRQNQPSLVPPGFYQQPGARNYLPWIIGGGVLLLGVAWFASRKKRGA